MSLPKTSPSLRLASSAAISHASPSQLEDSERQLKREAKERRKIERQEQLAIAPTASEEQPFIRLFALPRGLPGSTYLDAVHESAFHGAGAGDWLKAADVILSGPCSAPVLERVLHILTGLPPGSAAQTGRALSTTLRLVQAAGHSDALIFVDAGVSHTLRLLEHFAASLLTEGRDTRVTAQRVIYQHDRLVRTIAGSNSAPSAARLPATLQASLARVVRHLIFQLGHLPSSSSEAPTIALRPASLDWLLAPAYCTPETLDLIMTHLGANELSDKQWANVAATCFAAAEPVAGLKALSKTRTAGQELAPWERLGSALKEKTFRAAAEILEPLLRSMAKEDREKLRRHAWSVLATIAAKDKHVSAEELVRLAEAIPDDVYCAGVITPLLGGLMRHHDFSAAAKVWETLLAKHRKAPPEERPRYLDAAALTAGAKLKYARVVDAKAGSAKVYDPTPDALRLMDWYAAKPPLPIAPDAPPTAGKPSAVKVPGSVPLDVAALNSLMSMCRASGSAGLAFRLWRAAKPRWGLAADDGTLALLLDTARLGFARFEAADSMAVRLRLIADAIGSQRSRSNPMSLPESHWRECPVVDIANGYGYSWREEYGALQPWQLARDVFDGIVLGNWPTLISVKSPLAGGALSVGRLWGSSEEKLPALVPASSETAHVLPGPRAFQAYIALLARTRADPSSVPRALAWMRALGVRPLRKTLTTALLFVNEHEGPRRLVKKDGPRLMRDEQILAEWLREWCEDVPDESEVAAFRRERELKQTQRRR